MADITDELLTISNAVFGQQIRSAIIDALTKMNAHIDRIAVAKSAGVYRFRGTITSTGDLPNTGISVGDCYYISQLGETFAWTGTAWNSIGAIVIDDSPSVNTGAEETTVSPTEEEYSGSVIPD